MSQFLARSIPLRMRNLFIYEPDEIKTRQWLRRLWQMQTTYKSVDENLCPTKVSEEFCFGGRCMDCPIIMTNHACSIYRDIDDELQVEVESWIRMVRASIVDIQQYRIMSGFNSLHPITIPAGKKVLW